MVSVNVVGEVDDAETVAVRICEHDKVWIVRVTIPADALGSERHEPRCFGRLFGSIGNMQVQVQSRVISRRRLAALERDLGPRAVRIHEDRRPSTEAVLANRVAQRLAPELRCPRHIADAQRDHPNAQHLRILPHVASLPPTISVVRRVHGSYNRVGKCIASRRIETLPRVAASGRDRRGERYQ
jgi:hypothetical protein